MNGVITSDGFLRVLTSDSICQGSFASHTFTFIYRVKASWMSYFLLAAMRGLQYSNKNKQIMCDI